MNRRLATTTLVTILTIAGTVRCGNLFGQETAEMAPANLADATAFIEPPLDFDPLLASGEELAQYGFPPRPDTQSAPRAYAAWRKAIKASGVRIVPELEQTRIFAGSNPVHPALAAASGLQTLNWSGAAVLNNATSYNNSDTFYYVEADYVVPVARQTYGVCDGGWDREMSWVGIDGFRTSNAIKAGTESDAYCNKSATATRYYAWFEWFPNSATRIKNFPVHPGDDIFVEVWHTSATQGYAFLINFQTNLKVTVSLNAPQGASLIGNSAEWVVERPLASGEFATLSSYISEYFSACEAVTEDSTEYFPDPSLLLTMVDGNGHTISYPSLLGADAIWLQSERSVE